MRRRKPTEYGDRRTLPIFDRGAFVIYNPETRIGFSVGTGGQAPPRIHRCAADRQAPKEVVTARLLGDPKPGRAGRAPDCEDSLRAEQSAEAYRLMGREPPAEGYGVMDLEKVRSRIARLAPRRWRPRQEAAE